MITDGLLMIGVVLGLAGLLIVLEKTTGWKFFKYVPAMVLMYLICAGLNTLGVFGDAKDVRAPLKALKDVALPAMIFLLLLGCDLRRIMALGPKLLLTFFVTAASIMVGMILAFLLFRSALDPESGKALGALLGSWTGGSANMVAVQDIVKAPENIFGYALITDTVVYSVWLMLMFSAVLLSDRFNRFTKADTSYLDGHIAAVEEEKRPISVTSLAGLGFGSILIATLAIWIGGLLPAVGTFINSTAWTIIIVSVLGLIFAQTPLARAAGSAELGTLMLFIVIGQIATGSDFAGISQAPVYLGVGVVTLLIHAIIMVVYAKLTRTELFSIVVASVANVGGIASAPVVAGTFSRQLVPVGILFALIGTLMGTWVGLLGAQIMQGL